ncbi:hypothetical protein JCM9140_2234 [Halalkalibacter wakoensis JCM 9140]|uniref:Uncharacterized protein n=1 Tax=Halalkalibacter wakoensis JCM 9140 TaxID=1236970 RepID=W4Q2H7_9BACI|nr:S4 domain-containing protein YaaA [Halalkalibacter wakoensis]GAE26197.1 hypothetical protein JCM9140_2234 [Halalkalibacter wakoensis JCM 9140]
MNSIVISTAYITLGQMLKEAGIIDTGGMAKWYLSEHIVYVNDQEENRRGKKLVPGDTITLEDGTKFEIVV